MNQLAERSVLMRFSAPCIGQHRTDKKTTREIQDEKKIGRDGGKWVADLYPEDALKAVKQKQTEARDYHDTVTLPFGCRREKKGVESEGGKDKKTPAIGGVGILSACLIMEYGEKMRAFKEDVRHVLETTFLANPREWIDWAIGEHNGTFNPDNYPGCTRDASGQIQFDEEVFRAKVREGVSIFTEPLPVPDAEHFSERVSSLLGTDVESVNIRVRDSATEAARELMRRLIEPVRAMAAKLSEAPKEGKDCPIFRDTLVGNLQDIAALAPKLNLTGDTQIDEFTKEVELLARYSPDALRKFPHDRAAVAAQADEIAKRMSSYKLSL